LSKIIQREWVLQPDTKDKFRDNRRQKSRQFGRMKGKMWMADDWEVPLD